MRHGLLKASFIPPRRQRELREVVRYRVSLIQERAAEANRIQKGNRPRCRRRRVRVRARKRRT